MTLIEKAKECERDLRKGTHNLIVSNYFSVDDMCEIVEALEKADQEITVTKDGELIASITSENAIVKDGYEVMIDGCEVVSNE